jgi:hypothetical protein
MYGAAVWNRQQVEGVLQDLLIAFEPLGAVLADLRIASSESDGRETLRLYALRSRYSGEPPQEQTVEPAEYHTPSVGWHAIRNRSPVAFNRAQCPSFRTICRDSDRVECGVDIPLKLFANGHNVDGVLSLDFEKACPVDAEMLTILFNAARKMSWIANGNCPDEVTHTDEDNLIVNSRVHAQTGFQHDLQSICGIHIQQIYVKQRDGWYHMLSSGASCAQDIMVNEMEQSVRRRVDSQERAVSTPHLHDDPYEAERLRYGVQTQVDSGNSSFVFPLYLAGTLAGAVVGQIDVTSSRSVEGDVRRTTLMKGAMTNERLSRITDAWNRFANGVQGLRDDWVLEFQKGGEGAGMIQYVVNVFWKGVEPDLSI